jgi:DNA/RNA-binding domain of Phe-tRNA-synthetase-like protein
LFACHLEWHDNGNIAAYEELLAALDDPDERNRAVAEALLKRRSPRPRSGTARIEVW